MRLCPLLSQRIRRAQDRVLQTTKRRGPGLRNQQKRRGWERNDRVQYGVSLLAETCRRSLAYTTGWVPAITSVPRWVHWCGSQDSCLYTAIKEPPVSFASAGRAGKLLYPPHGPSQTLASRRSGCSLAGRQAGDLLPRRCSERFRELSLFGCLRGVASSSMRLLLILVAGRRGLLPTFVEACVGAGVVPRHQELLQGLVSHCHPEVPRQLRSFRGRLGP